MSKAYTALASFAATWGLLYAVLIFAIALAYALWPSNRMKFEKAARLPLSEKEPGNDRPLT